MMLIKAAFLLILLMTSGFLPMSARRLDLKVKQGLRTGKAAPEYSKLKKDAAEKVAPGKAAHEKDPAEKTAAENASPDKDTSENVPQEKGSAEKTQSSMADRRSKIMEAQLLSRGFSKEEARSAVSQGPEAIAALNAAGPTQTPTPSSALTVNAVLAVPAESRAIDITRMFPDDATAATSSAAMPVLEAAAVADITCILPNNVTSHAARSDVAVPGLTATPAIDIAWMFENSTLGDEDMAQEIGTEYADEVGVAIEAFECQCCFDEVPAMTGLKMSPGVEGCEHTLCPECFKRLISGQIQNKESCVCPLCPATSPSVVPSWLVRRVLGDEMARQLSLIEQIHLGQADGGQLRLWQCPTPDCTNRQAVDENFDPQQVLDGQRIFDCGCCNKRICIRCNVEEHQGFSCQQFREWRAANDSTEQSYAAMMQEGLIKPCPNCAVPILKTEGCNFMTCPTCNDPNRMCWVTGKKRYGPDGCGGGHNCH